MRLVADKARIKGVLLASAKKTFFAGAPLKTLLTLKPEDAATLFAEIEANRRAIARSRRSAGRWSRCSPARRWAAAGKWRSPRTRASRSPTSRSGSACPR